MEQVVTNQRYELHEILCDALGSDHVYFQPPESIKMEYPAIVYERADIDDRNANNDVYLSHRKYTLTVIDKNPDSNIVTRVSRLKFCRFNRHFERNNLNHDVFVLYY